MSGFMFRWRRLLVTAAAAEDPLTHQIRRRLPHLPVEVIPEKSSWRPAGSWDPALSRLGKETLLLTHQKGPFWRACPGTKGYICCGYQTLQVLTNCPLDCSYCILQSYLNLPAITIFTNWDDLEQELDQQAREENRIIRLGTGEFGDSLALDELLGLNHWLITRLPRWPHLVLELKTKWHRVEPLLPLGPNRQVIFAWSVNPPRIIRQEEHYTAPLQARLTAARRCVAAGFRVAFHFDPIIYYPGWEADYQAVVEQIFTAVPPDAVAWISLGALRFMPALTAVMRQRFPASTLADQEFILGLDGKKRYFKSLRVELFSRLREWLQQAAPEVFVYLCMESPWVWEQVFGWRPRPEEVAARLDAQAIKKIDSRLQAMVW